MWLKVDGWGIARRQREWKRPSMTEQKTNRREFVKSCGAVFAAAAIVPAQLDGSTTSESEDDRVISYPSPKGEILSPDYTVEVNGKSVPVYRVESRWHDKKYSAAYFDFSGSVTVKIAVNLPEARTDSSLKDLVVLPAKYAIRPVVANGVATFTIDRPFNISFEPTGERSPLHLFANPIETERPKPDDPGVIYFGPGIHKPGRIDLTAGQTLYIAGGAIVKAAVTSTGDNIRIMGRGILDGSDWPHFQGPATRMVWPSDGRNIVIQDILIRGAWTWTVAPTRCDEVSISNLRICGSRCGNDDGIDPCNSSNVTIRNCFIHTDDDGVAVKGIAAGNQDPKASENILVENCTFWIDYANGFRLGAESRARACRNFVARNIDFIHFPRRSQVAVFFLHPEDNMPMEDVVFENVRIHGEVVYLARLMPMDSPSAKQRREQELRALANHWKIPGLEPYPVLAGAGPYIHKATFKDIVVEGSNRMGEPSPKIYLRGLSEVHNVRGISFENLLLDGRALTCESPNVVIGDFVSQVRINDENVPSCKPR